MNGSGSWRQLLLVRVNYGAYYRVTFRRPLPAVSASLVLLGRGDVECALSYDVAWSIVCGRWELDCAANEGAPNYNPRRDRTAGGSLSRIVCRTASSVVGRYVTRLGARGSTDGDE